MSLCDERFTGAQAPSASIKYAEIAEIERLTKEWLKRNKLKEVPVVGTSEMKSESPIYNTALSSAKLDTINQHRSKPSKTGYMNIYKYVTGYVCYIGDLQLAGPCSIDECIEKRYKHRKKMGMPKARDSQ